MRYEVMRRSLRIKIKNRGTPISAVNAPTGNCRGAAAIRASVSAKVSNVPPSSMDAGTLDRKSVV
jgi:hypothetical protein